MTRLAVTTRPSTAAALMEAGIPCRRIPNVFDPSRSAWEYEDRPESRRIVAATTAKGKKEEVAE